MKPILASFMLFLLPLWGALSFAQQQPRFPVDPQTKWAVGAKQKSADELKRQLDAGSKPLIIDARPSASFQKETLPGAISIPLEELEEHLKKMPKDAELVFTCASGTRASQAAKLAEEYGFKSATFCPIDKWKEKGYQTEAGKKP